MAIFGIYVKWLRLNQEKSLRGKKTVICGHTFAPIFSVFVHSKLGWFRNFDGNYNEMKLT